MAKTIIPQIHEIIKRHTGDKTYIVFRTEEGVSLQTGRIESVSQEQLVFHSESQGQDSLQIPFYQNGDKNIFHIYNTNHIDLVNAKKTDYLSTKLRNGSMRKIMKSLKPFLKTPVQFVYKLNDAVVVSLGEFTDMGISEVVLKPAPFFNDTLKLRYDQILHIYSKNVEDLIDIKEENAS